MKITKEQGNIPFDEKLNYLKDKKNYPGGTRFLTIKETHMSVVFLTDQFVYKMKRPVHYSYLNLSTLEDRKLNCEREVVLNKRFAPEVYKGVVPLIKDNSGNFKLEGKGKVIEWLVKMDRLPDHLMMNQKIVNSDLSREDVIKFGKVLASFYKCAPICKMDKGVYIQRLRNYTHSNINELKRPEFRINDIRINRLLNYHSKFISDNLKMLESRSEKIVEAHGDLRPEHIWLKEKPVIIDCLEFNKDLRILDPLEELAYFSIECEILNSVWVGDCVINVYEKESKDLFDKTLVDFYKSIRAILRALSSFRHILELEYGNDIQWRIKGENYLKLAEKYIV